MQEADVFEISERLNKLHWHASHYSEESYTYFDNVPADLQGLFANARKGDSVLFDSRFYYKVTGKQGTYLIRGLVRVDEARKDKHQKMATQHSETLSDAFGNETFVPVKGEKK